MGKYRKEDDFFADASSGFQNDLFPVSSTPESPESQTEKAEVRGVDRLIKKHSRGWWTMMGLVALGLVLMVILFALYYTVGSASAVASETDGASETALDKVASTAGKSVVTVACSGASGSGFAVTTDGMIVTAASLIENGGTIQVKTGGRKKYAASLVWTDADSGLAVIKVKAQNLTPAVLDDENHLYTGEKLAVLGRSGGKLLSGKTAVLDDDANVLAADGETFDVRDLVRIASTKAVSAGQPLFDNEGEAVGVVVSAESGGTYAMPSYYLAAVVDQLITTGRFVPNTIGVAGDSAAQVRLRTGQDAGFDGGVCVREVAPGSGAERAGLHPGDVITSISGESVNNPREMAAVIARKKPGSKVILTVFRAGRKSSAGDSRIWVDVSGSPEN
ncbi:S1C family serine protease [Pseudoramibacter sp.]|jgi:S1-C subfamily serine protease|uniref:S1C family serine protease n=1 Tax=Pseudoramibacter sp. TaxID=2034862 RepID=UPI0025F86763|nr:S1C family serine protease [Pseudoramibacter sp.]MCH4071902.1 S1C family serine protease [Pseudoramibacter sp.]MCH4105670.1 S1C family serine protease [Pseudoramibacter sp.]